MRVVAWVKFVVVKFCGRDCFSSDFFFSEPLAFHVEVGWKGCEPHEIQDTSKTAIRDKGKEVGEITIGWVLERGCAKNDKIMASVSQIGSDRSLIPQISITDRGEWEVVQNYDVGSESFWIPLSRLGEWTS